MMHQIEKFDYADVDDCQILGLPYVKGKRKSFLNHSKFINANFFFMIFFRPSFHVYHFAEGQKRWFC